MVVHDLASPAALLHAAERAVSIRPEVPLALATLVGVEGSSFRQPGARLLVDTEGRCLAGAISGGCLEADVAQRASEVCATGRAIHLTYDLRADLQTIWGFDAVCEGIAHVLLEPLPDTAWLKEVVSLRNRRAHGCIMTVTDAAPDAGFAPGTLMVLDRTTPNLYSRHPLAGALHEVANVVHATRRGACIRSTHPEVTIFADPVVPPVALHVIGASRGAEAFARIALAMGWQVTIIDHRPALLEALEVPDVVTRRFARPEQAGELVADDNSAVALLTHIFDTDRAWLDALLPRGHAYIGVLGSRQRAHRLLEAIDSNIASAQVHAPIGLDLGGEDPESIALAAIAEIQSVLHQRPAGKLRERRSPIHDRTPTPVDMSSAHVITPAICRLPE